MNWRARVSFEWWQQTQGGCAEILRHDTYLALNKYGVSGH